MFSHLLWPFVLSPRFCYLLLEAPVLQEVRLKITFSMHEINGLFSFTKLAVHTKEQRRPVISNTGDLTGHT